MKSHDIRYIAMGASLLVAVLMLFGKMTAWWLTGSAAILSDAAESVVHIVATLLVAASLWYARQEACERHPYGHGKIAYFSAGFEGSLILSAALFIFLLAIRSMVAGPEVQEAGLGVLITGFLAMVNLALGLSLIRIGKKTNALILVANGQHVMTDMWTSLGVVAGMGLVWLTGNPWFDPIVALLVGFQILVMAMKLIRRSFGGLLDEANTEMTGLLLQTIEASVGTTRIEGFHQLRHRQSNDVIWVEVHLLLPDAMPTGEAHGEVTKVEEAIRAAFSRFTVYITSHVEPASHQKAHPDGHTGLDDPFAAMETPPDVR